MDRKKIPFSNNFYVNSKGEVFDVNGTKRKTYRNGDGYVTTAIKTTDNIWNTFGVHRLVALTHIPNTNYKRTEVNHRDCDITHNDVKNLEWVTASENNIHSEIMRHDNSEYSVYSSLNGKGLSLYKNAHHAAKENNCTPLEIWDSIKEGIKINGLTYHFQSSKKSRPKELMYDRSKNLSSPGSLLKKSVKIINFYTGELYVFDSLFSASKYFNTIPSHIHSAISKNGKARIFLKKYQVQYTENSFPIITKEILERAIFTKGKRVLAYNISEQKYFILNSAAEFIRLSGLSKKTVTTKLKNNIIRKVNNWVFLYLNKENTKKLKTYISGPADL
jgi:hypothetical protein